MIFISKAKQSKAKQTEGNESRGYKDDDAPDYANAARKVVEALKQRDGLGSISGDGRGGRGPTGPDAGQSFDQDFNVGSLTRPSLSTRRRSDAGNLQTPSRGQGQGALA